MTRPDLPRELSDAQLDSLLRLIADPPHDPRLAARIAAAARQAPRAPQGLAARIGAWLGLDGPVPFLWQQATGLAALAVVGFVMGYGGIQLPGGGQEDPAADIAAITDALDATPFDAETGL